MRIITLLAISAMSLTAAAPAMAQMAKEGAMQGNMAHMSRADTRTMNSCKAMSHERMMRNRGCARMMQMHPDMMKSDNMMKQNNMMKKN